MFTNVNTLMLALIVKPLHNSLVMIHRTDTFERPVQPPRFFPLRRMEHTHAALHLEGSSLLIAQAAFRQPAPQHTELHQIADQNLETKLVTGDELDPVETHRLIAHCMKRYNEEIHQPSLDVALTFAQLHERSIKPLARAGLYGTRKEYITTWMQLNNTSPNLTIRAPYPHEGATSMRIDRSIDPSMPHTRLGFFFRRTASSSR